MGSLGRLRAPPYVGSQVSDDLNGFAHRKISPAGVFRVDLRRWPHYHLSIADDHIELIEGYGRPKVVAFQLLVLIPSTTHEI